jgi:hypothetical protein
MILKVTPMKILTFSFRKEPTWMFIFSFAPIAAALILLALAYLVRWLF